MVKFIVRRLLLMLLTMLLVSIAVFLITEAAPGNLARNVLGIHITPEQEASFLSQQGLDKPFYERYLYWLVGSDWRAERLADMPIQQITTEDGYRDWWAVGEDGTLLRWEMQAEDLIVSERQPDGEVTRTIDNERWEIKDPSFEIPRLQEHRAEVEAKEQLADADRQAILKELDQILAVLSDRDLSQPEMRAAVSGPESALEAMVEPEALQKQTAFREMAEGLIRRNHLMQVFTAYDQLTGPYVSELRESNWQSMGRQVSRAAEGLDDVDPTLAQDLREAGEALGSGELSAGRTLLESPIERLDRISGSLRVFLEALNVEDYALAVGMLRTLSDPAETPLDDAQLAILPDLLDEIGAGVKDDAPAVGEPLLVAAEHLRAEDRGSARQKLSEAAEALEETSLTIARSGAAQGAGVARVFWGVDRNNRAVQWEKGTGDVVWRLVPGSGWLATTGGPTEYVPLQRGLLRGDPGLSLRTGRPVAGLLFTRVRNSLVLAGLAFVIVMPIALVLGLIAGLNEGKALDRILSLGGMAFSVTPEFVTGIFLILIFAFWLGVVPGATVFGAEAPWSRPAMLILPVATLTLVELGYVLRITRSSMVTVMKEPYIRTAYLKGLTQWRVVVKHAIRNALMAPLTIIMLHVNWLLGGIVVVEVIFGYPGLGSYVLDSALFRDVNALQGGAMILVAVAVGTQLVADVLYTFLNPRIRYD